MHSCIANYSIANCTSSYSCKIVSHATIVYLPLGAILDDNCTHNDDDCYNTAVLAVLGVLVIILLVGLTISVVVNIWLCLKNKR